MKNSIIILVTIISLSTHATDKYTQHMESNIETLFTAQTVEELQLVANKFDRIASTEKDKWLPKYYASLANVWMATREEGVEKKDNYLGQAQLRIDQAAALSEGNAEIAALRGFIYMIGITVDPASRGATYGQKAFMEFGKAIELNPENPRALFFKGQMEFGTAQFFKSDTSAACKTMARSLELFDKFTPETAIHPNWGSGFARRTVENCNVEQIANDNQ